MGIPGGAAEIGRDSELYALREAGKRMADALNLAVIGLGGAGTGRFMAFSLADGSTDHTIYDSRTDALTHQRHESLCWYEQIRPKGYSADECALTLMYARAMHDAGHLRPAADTPAPILPVRIEDARRKFRQLRTNRR